MVLIYPSDQAIRPLDLIAGKPMSFSLVLITDINVAGRLSKSVNKLIALARVNESSGQVNYLTIRWDQEASNPVRSSMSLSELNESLLD
jgi:hypothetical protein